jgi:hypothetical protein
MTENDSACDVLWYIKLIYFLGHGILIIEGDPIPEAGLFTLLILLSLVAGYFVARAAEFAHCQQSTRNIDIVKLVTVLLCCSGTWLGSFLATIIAMGPENHLGKNCKTAGCIHSVHFILLRASLLIFLIIAEIMIFMRRHNEGANRTRSVL